eukprot:TRINITY_DN2366_c0_g1_i2.p2 TRINITY_DN2366_c0_g1~~TRINITY_DN2366_c0_g1_i2.p2  ORF type:complete len:182 (-),score=28.75 TRINITY_DN2366_c0_g1_i2:751-1296(-)
MVTAPLLMQGAKVELPKTPSAPLDKKDEEPVIVSVKQDGTYYINLGKEQETAKPLKDIKDTVSKVLRQKPETVILVWGDTKVEYGIVVSLMTELQKAGAPSVGLVTDPPDQWFCEMGSDFIIPALATTAIHIVVFGLVAFGWEANSEPRNIVPPKYIEAKIVELETKTKKKASAKKKPKKN